jgi:hypothetical protein
MTNTFYVLMAVYVVSAILQYRWFQIAYSPDGRLGFGKIEGTDWYYIFCPVVNTFICIYSYVFESPYKNK